MNAESQRRAGAMLPSDIADSWRRSAAAGLTPAHAIDPTPRRDGASGRLAVAAAPVLDAFETEIAGSGLGVVLADRSCRIVDYRLGDRGMRKHAARVGLDLGAEFSEETSGTNAIATPAETRRPIFVDGEQHFLTALHGFSCYGLPILHPATSRLVGVIDVMVGVGGATPLMRPALRQLVAEIRGRLLALSGAREAAVLDAFLGTPAGGAQPVVAISGDLTISNRAARRELTPGDLARLAGIAAPPREARDLRISLVLDSGATATVQAHRVPGADGAVYTLGPERPAATPVPRGRRARRHPGDLLRAEITRLRAGAGHVLLVGEPGSGRTTAAEAVSGMTRRRFLRAGAVCARELAEEAAGPGTTVIEDVHRLGPADAQDLASALAGARGRVVLTAAHDGHALTGACAERLVLTPLRDRADELAVLAGDILRDEGADGSRLTLATLQLLRRHPWPGNLRELRTVLRAALAARPAGDVEPADLPAAYRDVPSARTPLGPLAQAEHDAIVAALRRTGGNKVQAARHLGISRSTLYQRIRVYGIAAR